jgi:Mn-containing catalase
MLLEGVNGELKNAAERSDLMHMLKGKSERESIIHEAATSPAFLIESAGGPTVTDSNGYPWNGMYVNANGDIRASICGPTLQPNREQRSCTNI